MQGSMDMSVEKVVIWGAGNQFEKWHRVIKGMDDYIDIVVDSYVDKDEIYGHKIFKPEILQSDYYKVKTVVIMASALYYSDILNFLRKDYGFSEDRILSAEEWIGTGLERSLMRIHPMEVAIDASTACQLDCLNCYMRKHNSGAVGSGVLKYEDFECFIYRNPHITKVELSNSGEPFLNPDMERILEFAYKMKVDVTLLNGVNFNNVSERVIEALVKYNVKAITFSIDGASQETYSIYRRKGNFNTVINNLKLLNEYKKKYRSREPEMVWQFILMEHNEDDIYKAKIMASELGMNMFYKLDWGGNYNPREPEKVEAVTGLDYFKPDYFKKEKHKASIQHDYLQFCHQMIFQPRINWDGRLLGCCTVYRDDWKINCFSGEDLDEYVNRPEYKSAVASILKRKPVTAQGPCLNCKFNQKAK